MRRLQKEARANGVRFSLLQAYRRLRLRYRPCQLFQRPLWRRSLICRPIGAAGASWNRPALSWPWRGCLSVSLDPPRRTTPWEGRLVSATLAPSIR